MMKYNYLTLLTELQRTLDLLSNSPTCSIVLNSKAEIIEINKPASDLLKIKNIDDYKNRKMSLDVDSEFYKIIGNLMNGSIVCDERFKFKCADNSIVSVNLNASLYCKLKDVFIFQFNEIMSQELIESSENCFNYN